MENQEQTTSQVHEEGLNAAVPCHDCDEVSICNCESNEQITPYYSDTEELPIGECCEPPRSRKKVKEQLKKTCCEVSDLCQKTAKRLAKDLKQTNGNPYLKHTSTCRIELYRSPEDEHPIDSFGTECTKSCSARALAVLGGAAILLLLAGELVMKKLLK